MTYEVDFIIGSSMYSVRGPDTDGILAVIDGLQTKNEAPPQRLREAYAQVNTSRIERDTTPPVSSAECRDAAEATLTRMGYTWNGGVLWRPPIGPAPAFDETPLPPLEDPHAELRKTWAPEQTWQARRRDSAGEWIYIAGKPHWHADQEYRRAPEDGWITWEGGPSPVRRHAKVQLRLKNGFVGKPIPAHTVAWNYPLHHADSLVAYRVVSTEPEPADDGWINWTGGPMPVEAGTRVRYLTRSDYEGVQLAGVISWDHENKPRRGDIVAYKVVAPCA